MYIQKKRELSSRNRRFKAMLFTLAFHLVLVAGIVYSIDSDFKDLLPDVVKELIFDSEKEIQEVKNPSPKV